MAEPRAGAAAGPGRGRPGEPGDGRWEEPGDGRWEEPGDGRPEEPGDGRPEEPGDGRPEEARRGGAAERRVPAVRWLPAVLPLLLGALPCAGALSLPSPRALRVRVLNTNFTLSWEYGHSPPGLAFWAQFQWPELEEGGWQQLPGCQAVVGTACDFSSAISEYYDPHYLRVRAQAGPLVSPWSSVLEMVPEHEAQIGPPGLELKSSNGVIEIKVSPPEANQVKKMWLNDLRFKYNLVFWENSSQAQPQSRAVFPLDTVEGLAPGSTFCFQVQASLPREGKRGLFSAPSCVQSTARAHSQLCAASLRVRALDLSFQLHWSGPQEQGLSYSVHFLPGFLKQLPQDPWARWRGVPGCQGTASTHCDFSAIVTTTGFYHLRVLATRGTATCLSREIRVDPLRDNEIGPPGVRLDLSDSLLHILISPPGGAEREAMRDHYDLCYRILCWRNSSHVQELVQQKEVKQTMATVPAPAPSSLYCVQVQAFSSAYNKSSAYSQQQCIHTPAGTSLPLIIFGIFMGALLLVLLVAAPLVFVLYQAYNKIKYVFFPSCQPPLNIESFGAELLSSPYLSAAEEPVESCCVIESLVPEEGAQGDLTQSSPCKQSSRDSGNYSNEDNTADSSQGSRETLGQELG